VIAWCERSNSFEIFVNDKKSPAHCDHSAVMLQEAKDKAKATKEAKASKVADMLHSIVDRALDKPPAATPGHCYSQLVPSALPSVAHMMMMI